MIAISASQKLFFDSDAVLRTVSKAKIGVLSRTGALIMTFARRSMRKVNKKGEASRPDNPPKERLGHLKRGRYGVQFGYDPATESVVVGAEVFPGLKRRTSDTGPATLEYGGDIEVTEARKRDGTWNLRAAAWARVNGQDVRVRKAEIEPRPYMRPALEANLPKLSEFWADAMEKV